MFNKTLQVAAIGLLLLGCTGPEDGVMVFAAASLRAVMQDASERWTGSARISTAGSQVLRRQLEEGAPADIFIPASFAYVQGGLIEARLEPPALLACNSLVLVVPRSSRLRTFEELPLAERIVLGTPEVPVGAYADRMLAGAIARYGAAWRERVLERVVSREIDVRQVLAKVTLGEADAALVYRSDAELADVRRIDPPMGLEVSARYPIALTRNARPEARDLVRWLRAAPGRAVFLERGFDACPVGDGGAP